MDVTKAIIDNPIKVAVGVLLFALFGTVALLKMPLQLTPEVQTPTITIETRWGGASPQEVEQEIVIEQEEQLKGVEGLQKMSSESSDSSGKIILEFAVGTDLSKTIVDVISRLEQVREYPEDADRPVISTANANDRPIAWFILSAKPATDDSIRQFADKYPALREPLNAALQTQNPGLRSLRLRALLPENPAIAELLPPPELDINKLRRFTEDEIEARFERVAGVSQANVIGGLSDELQVVVDPQKLAARQLTINDVRNVLRGLNKDTSGGDFWEGKRRYVVRTLGQFRSPEQVERQLLAYRDGAPVYVRDIGTVELGYKKPDGMMRRYGDASIGINALRETGANVMDVMAGLQRVASELNADILNQRGLALTQVYDETIYIASSVNLVQENIFIGGALTMAVLMLFLNFGFTTLLLVPVLIASAVGAAYVNPWFFAITLAIIFGAGFSYARGALVVGLAIPTSIIGTFLVLGALGRSLNVISLAGMAFAVGMLVDNAVVVLENIVRRYEEKGETAWEAACRGTNEVWGAVLSSTLTTVAVFLPVVFVEQEAGQLFRDIALAITAAVSLSLLVSVTVIPTAAARLLRGSPRRVTPSATAMHSEHAPTTTELARSTPSPTAKTAAAGFGARLGQLFSGSVVAVNAVIQRYVVARLAVIVLLVGVSVGLSYALWPKVEYLPTGNRNLVFGILLPPPGYNLDELRHLGQIAEDELRPYWDINAKDPASFAHLDAPAIDDFFYVARGRSVFLGLRAVDPARVGELVPLVQKAGAKLPGTFAVAKQSSLFENGLTGGRTVEVEITGPDLITLVGLGGQTMGMIKGLIPTAQVRPVPSLDLSSPELHVVPKLVQAADLGVSTADLGYTVDALVDGAYAGDYFLEGKKIDLRIVGQEAWASQSQDISSLPIATPDGQLVPLEAVADVILASGPEQINHRERLRVITIEVSPPPEMALEDAMTVIRTQVVDKLKSQGRLNGGYRMTLAGTADKLRDAWQALQFNIVLALLITYLLMAALFESWLYPFVIILTVPLGAVGGVLGLQLLNLYALQPLDVLTMLGFIILIGTVVNNPILIVHQSLVHMREDGMPHTQAILESVRSRIRPIFMTTTTTVLGLVPLIVIPGSGSELYRGLGAVVLGGLVVSTAFTLIFVPTLFRVMLDAKIWVTERVESIRHAFRTSPTGTIAAANTAVAPSAPRETPLGPTSPAETWEPEESGVGT